MRHARPVRVENVDGSPADPPLSEVGHRQAELLAAWLAEEGGVDAVYSSPLARARETADAIASLLGLTVVIEDGVAEFDRDHPAYVPMEELKQTDYDEWLRLMKGGFEETFDIDHYTDLMVRTVEKIIAENPGRKVAVSCHGGVVNAYAAHLLKTELVFAFDVTYSSITRIMAASTGERSIMTVNEHAHLRPLKTHH